MVHEASFLESQQVQRMVDADYQEALAVASETVYGPYLAGAGTASEIEVGLERFLADEYGFMDQVCARTHVARFMHLKYDFHNLRVILKRHYFGEASDGELLSSLGTVDIGKVSDALEHLVGPGVPEYVTEVIETAKAIAGRGGSDPQRLDTLVDRAYLEKRLEVAREEGSSLLVDFCRAAIDVANLRILLRGINLGKDRSYYAEALADGGRLPRSRFVDLAGEPFESVVDRLLESRYGRMLSDVLARGEGRARLTSLDRASDEYLLEQVRGFSRVSVGPERIVRYMLTRENEAAALRIIFLGKLHRLSGEVIEAQLPAGYLKAASG